MLAVTLVISPALLLPLPHSLSLCYCPGSHPLCYSPWSHPLCYCPCHTHRLFASAPGPPSLLLPLVSPSLLLPLVSPFFATGLRCSRSHTTPHHTTPHHTTPHHTTPQHSTPQHNTTQHNTTQHNSRLLVLVGISSMGLRTVGCICVGVNTERGPGFGAGCWPK